VALELDHRLVSMTFKAKTQRVPDATKLLALGYEIVRDEPLQILAKLTRSPDVKVYVLKNQAKIMIYSKGSMSSVRQEASKLL